MMIGTTIDRATDTAGPLWRMPARLIHAPADRTAEELLALAKNAAYDASAFEERPPFFVQARISNDALDSYFTRMHASTLKNFAAEAAAGVTVLASHNSRTLGVGRSLTGVLVKGQGDEPSAVLSDFYTVPGLRLADVSTDDVIEGIRTGLIHDTSVGFYGGTMECSICGRDLLRDWDCPHWPGETYPRLDKKGNQIGEDLAIAWIKDAHLSEYSVVYDGATPGAEIVAIKAAREIEAGRLRPETARLLEARWRLRLPGVGHRYSGADVDVAPTAPVATKEGQPMSETERAAPVATPQETPEHRQAIEIRSVLRARGALLDNQDTLDAVRALLDERDQLRPLAEEGRAYRADLIAAALAEGVRAWGEKFDQEAYRAMLGTVPIEQVKRFAESWKAIGDAALAGGRQTVEAEQTNESDDAGERGQALIPDAAFRA